MNKINPLSQTSTPRSLYRSSARTITPKPQLPSIASHSASKTNTSYLSTIPYDISGNIQYDDMDNKKLTIQQCKLKGILKKINQDTRQFVKSIIEKPKKTRFHKAKSTILQVNQQEIQNSSKIMSNCQFQILALTNRLQNLTSRESIQAQIQKCRQQITECQTQINKLKLQNSNFGKDIVKYNTKLDQGEMRKYQTDVYLIERRHSHLQIQDIKVRAQIQQIKTKLNAMGDKYIQADRFMKAVREKQEKESQGKENATKLIEKKSKLDYALKKKQFYIQNAQHQYYKLLRQLQSCGQSNKNIQQKTKQFDESIRMSQDTTIKLQRHLKSIKKKKQETQNSINQFISRSRLMNKTEQQQKESQIQNKIQTEQIEESMTASLKKAQQYLKQPSSTEIQIKQQPKKQQKQIKRVKAKSVLDLTLKSIKNQTSIQQDLPELDDYE